MRGIGRSTTRVVSFWSSDPGYVKHSLGFYLSGVAASAGLVGVFSHLRTILSFHLGLRASKRLHRALLRRVLHAPVSFFDTTPVGRIVQRFSKDTDQVHAARMTFDHIRSHSIPTTSQHLTWLSDDSVSSVCLSLCLSLCVSVCLRSSGTCTCLTVLCIVYCVLCIIVPALCYAVAQDYFAISFVCIVSR